MQSSPISTIRQVLTLPVIVIAMGYFVDIYDLILFGVVRVASLSELGLNAEEITTWGSTILNMQMGGMLIGGILWGILGDKKGRLSVLFASIILYSIANFLNAFVTTVCTVTFYRRYWSRWRTGCGSDTGC
jgi:MFS family permease